MHKIIRFYCNDCGGEDLDFPAVVTYKPDSGSFVIKRIAQRFAFCNRCERDKPVFQSEEAVYKSGSGTNEKQPVTGSFYDPMKQRGNL